MKAEIDQSGKFEQLNTHTVVSMANHSCGSVYITASEKIKLIKFLRKTIVARADLVQTVFSTLIFILIVKFGKNITKLEIDEEYSNRVKFIRETINKLYIISNIKNKPEISFVRVGKLSPSHRLSWKIHRKKEKTKVLVLKYEDIIKYWNLKK